MDHIRVLEKKLQNSLNENAKLRVKQREDQKLWKGLESKFLSTKSLCDQVTETLQHLASQVQGGKSRYSLNVFLFTSVIIGLQILLDWTAEKDKKFFEGKLSESSKAIDCLRKHMNALSLKFEAAEESVRNRESLQLLSFNQP